MKYKKTKISIGIAFFIVSIVLIITFGISPFAKYYIEKHSKELIGRKVLLKDLHFNIFNGVLKIDSIRMYEKNDQTLFSSIDSFYLDLKLSALISKNLEIQRLRVVRPYATVIQKGDKFNFDDLIPKPDKKKPTDINAFPKKISIDKILIYGGNLVYTDSLINNTIRMKDLGVQIPHLAFERGNTLMGIQLKIGKDAILNNKLTMDMANSEYTLQLNAQKLPINIIKPYLKESLNIGELEGLVNGEVTIKGNSKHVLDFTVSGKVDANNFYLSNSKGVDIASVEQAQFVIDKIYLPKSTYLFQSINASQAKLNFILRKNSTNITDLLATQTNNSSENAAGPNPTVKINDLHIQSSNLSYTDETIRQPFKILLSQIDIQSKNVDINKTNVFDMNVAFPNNGKANMKWKGNINDFKNQELRLNLQNIDIKQLSPYCYEYSAYDITKGNMNFNTKLTINNNFINSTNLIDVYKMSVGKKHKGVKVEYDVPLRLGVYVLKDKDDKIKLDIPVKGNLDSPEFSYKKIIFKTIVNLMVKVAVSPIRFLAGAMGLNPDKMESLPISALQTNITAEQYSQMNDLAEIYKNKPEMKINLIQWVDKEDAFKDLALYLAKKDFTQSTKLGQETAATDDEITAVNSKDPLFVNYIDSAIVRKGLAIKDYSFKEKLNVLYPDSVVDQTLTQIMNQRNLLFQEYLVKNCSIPMQNLMIKNATEEDSKDLSGKDRYKIEMEIAETE